jgi:hypothetical protein
MYPNSLYISQHKFGNGWDFQIVPLSPMALYITLNNNECCVFVIMCSVYSWLQNKLLLAIPEYPCAPNTIISIAISMGTKYFHHNMTISIHIKYDRINLYRIQLHVSHYQSASNRIISIQLIHNYSIVDASFSGHKQHECYAYIYM